MSRCGQILNSISNSAFEICQFPNFAPTWSLTFAAFRYLAETITLLRSFRRRAQAHKLHREHGDALSAFFITVL